MSASGTSVKLGRGEVAAVSVSKTGHWPLRVLVEEDVTKLPSSMWVIRSGAKLWTAPGNASRPGRTRGMGQLASVLDDDVDPDGNRLVKVSTAEGKVWVADDDLLPGNRPLGSSARSAISSALSSSGLGSVGAVLIDDVTGQGLLSVNPRKTKILASVTKLFTVSVAAERGVLSPGLAPRILLPSNNVLADQLAARIGSGSLRRGASLIAHDAGRLGARVTLADGSGLSRADRASPLEVSDLLSAIRTNPQLARVEDAMPLAGVSGTLAGRMRSSPAARRCRAKTGTLSNVSALAGYCRTLGERQVRFALLMNRTGVDRARSVQDFVLGRLAAER